jgi:hypothetical protein
MDFLNIRKNPKQMPKRGRSVLALFQAINMLKNWSKFPLYIREGGHSRER